MQAPLSPDEAARLQALQDYAVLDTLAEAAYDDITMLASYICKTPIALMSLVDKDRQWFKARIGLQATETPREYAFCAHAILRPNDVLVVPDASADPRFVDNPLVTGDPNIRFYAGAPLVTPRGDALGTICVIDRIPRELPPRMIEALLALSRQVVAHLEMRHVVAELDRGATELRSHQDQLEDYQRQLEVANAALAAKSNTDALTGLKNRRAFDTALVEESARSARHQSSVSLLMVDIDKFKPYNDTYGHPAGDAALREVARLLSAHSRPFDLVARYGGEEFTIILPKTDAQAALVVGERLRRAIETAPWTLRDVTVSIGASTTDGNRGCQALTAMADQAMYQVKQQGGNRVIHANQFVAPKAGVVDSTESQDRPSGMPAHGVAARTAESADSPSVSGY